MQRAAVEKQTSLCKICKMPQTAHIIDNINDTALLPSMYFPKAPLVVRRKWVIFAWSFLKRSKSTGY